METYEGRIWRERVVLGKRAVTALVQRERRGKQALQLQKLVGSGIRVRWDINVAASCRHLIRS
jgi:hypothetical protein